MTPTDPNFHISPLRWLSRVKLHPGQLLRDRVIAMRLRRRKPSVTADMTVLESVEPTITTDTDTNANPLT
jgi:hypothetical protein